MTPSHLAAALKVGSSQQRSELLKQAIVGRWTVRELRAKVSALRKNGGERRGRPRSSPTRSALTCVKTAALMLARADALLHASNYVDPGLLMGLQTVIGQAEKQALEARARLAELSARARGALAPTIGKARADRGEPKRVAG